MGIKKEENGTYTVTYNRTKKRGFKTKREAQYFEEEMRRAKDDNVREVYFSEVVTDYLKVFETEQNNKLTVQKAKCVFRDIILPNNKNIKMTKYNELMCRQFRDYLHTLPYSTSYKNYILGKYKAVFKHSCMYYGMSKNPAQYLKTFSKTEAEKMNKVEKEKQIWTTEEFNKFVECVKYPKYKVLYTVLFYTGMRIGEVLALQWKDIEDGKINVNHSITKLGELKSPKNKTSIRRVTLDDRTNKMLMKYKTEEMSVSGYNEEWYVFGRNKSLPRENVKRIKNIAVKSSGVKQIKIHDFRHSHASNLLNQGASIIAVSRRLGHSDINTTLSVYTHLMQNSEDEIIGILNKM